MYRSYAEVKGIQYTHGYIQSYGQLPVADWDNVCPSSQQSQSIRSTSIALPAYICMYDKRGMYNIRPMHQVVQPGHL